MALAEPTFSLGIEEEYFLVDGETGELAASPPESLLDDCVAELGERVTPEFLRAQIEIGTRVCRGIGEAREELLRLRGGVVSVAARYGLQPLVASTHPAADWRDIEHVRKERYDTLAHEMQAAAQRLLICGMHVHVGVENEELRIDLMNQARYFLPHLLCLSTSSPFWRGRDTGLKCYRLTVFDSLPRTGLPEPMTSWSEYQRMIGQMTSSGLVKDGSKIWWDLRPSSRFPTLEMRVCDVCTEVEDALAIAALFQCLLRMLFRLRAGNQRWREYPNMLIYENRWLAQRYGSAAALVDFGKQSPVPFAELLDEILEITAEDADALGCATEVAHARQILRHGTSADRQLACYLEAGGSERHDEAIRSVVAMLRKRSLVAA